MNSVIVLFVFCGFFCIENGYASSQDCVAQVSEQPPDPNSQCCGVDAAVPPSFLGHKTAVDQYPWLALIEYEKNGKTNTLCGGTLISGRYVMTAAYCVSGMALSIGTPTNIRLGEYDTSNEGPDCVDVENGGKDCTDGAVRIPIEKIVVHPQYSPKDQLKSNDIALIKMKESAPYTEFIRPICLPTKDIGSDPVNFTVAGWGTTYGPSPVKVQVKVPLVSLEKCQSSFPFTKPNVVLSKGQICAGGEKGKDSCKGDGGMPLMYENKKSYEVAGIVSFGVSPCGQEGIPSIYTKIYDYLPWIKSVISEN